MSSKETPRRAYIFSGGDWDASSLQSFNLQPREQDIVVAADSGVSRALELGWKISAVIGDMDSAIQSDIAKAEALGAEIIKHPKDKDALDLELAVRWALDFGLSPDISAPDTSTDTIPHLNPATSPITDPATDPAISPAIDTAVDMNSAISQDIIPDASPDITPDTIPIGGMSILGTLGGRPDCALAIMGLLELEELADVELELYLDGSRAILLRGTRQKIEITGSPGDGLSLIPFPFGSPALQVSATGVKWELRGETLLAGSTRGLSNEFVESKAQISTTSQLLVVYSG